MNYITTTQLRTKSKDLVNSLLNGKEVDLIHRSQIVGTIKPKKKEPKPLSKEDIESTVKMAKSLNLPKLSDKEIEGRYRKHLLKKHGKDLS